MVRKVHQCYASFRMKSDSIQIFANPQVHNFPLIVHELEFVLNAESFTRMSTFCEISLDHT